MQALLAQRDRPQHYKWQQFKWLVRHCRGKTTDFSEPRRSTVYLLIIKKEGNVSQNTALWAKAVFLCSFEWQSVALHLRPIILHQVSETDKTYKTGDEMMTAPHCSLLCTQHLHLIWCLSRRDEKKKPNYVDKRCSNMGTAYSATKFGPSHPAAGQLSLRSGPSYQHPTVIFLPKILESVSHNQKTPLHSMCLLANL